MTISIYILKHPVTDEIFYVGQTSKPIEVRLRQHLQAGNNLKKNKIVQDILADNRLPLIQLIESVCECKANKREAYWINYYHGLGYQLCNGNCLPQTDLADKLVQFFKERPAIVIRRVEKKAKIPLTSLTQALNGSRKLSHGLAEKIVPVIADYGWDCNPDEEF